MKRRQQIKIMAIIIMAAITMIMMIMIMMMHGDPMETISLDSRCQHFLQEENSSSNSTNMNQDNNNNPSISTTSPFPNDRDNDDVNHRLNTHDVVDFTIPSKDRTLLLLRMNLVAYPTCTEKLEKGRSCAFSPETMKDIFDQGLSIYGSNITTIEQENDASQNLADENWNILTNIYNFVPTIRSIPSDKAKFDFGVSAMEWTTADNNTTILVFRGSYTPGDYDNIYNWIFDYILEKSTDRMKRAWIDDAGLQWTDDLEDRFSNDNDRLNKVELRTVESLKRSKLPKQLVDAIASNNNNNNDTILQDDDDDDIPLSLTLQEAKSVGYWKVTKHIVDQVQKNAIANNRSLIITGHSQGGTRAQLASMYLRQKTGIAYPTITFAATGSACMSRLLFFTNANLLDDVNPFIVQKHMIDYVHPLDPWGNSMLGEDNGDQVCYWGKNALLQAQQQQQQHENDNNENNNVNVDDRAFKYCSKIYGMKGPTLIIGGRKDPNVKASFERCRYFTHAVQAVLYGLQNNLNEDGTPNDGGCHTILPIPSDDPDGKCPIGTMSVEEDEVVGVIVLLVLLLIAFLVCLCYYYTCYCCCCCRCRGQHRRHEQLRLVDDDDDNNLEEEESEDFYNDIIDEGGQSSSIIKLPEIS